MNALIIGLYGIFLLMVGASGNSAALSQMGREDAPGFLPWAISIGVLAVMSQNEYTAKIAKPFIVLLVLGFVLKNYANLETQFKTLYSTAVNASK